jgi:uncharacterized RDD family membrane protein YckC
MPEKPATPPAPVSPLTGGTGPAAGTAMAVNVPLDSTTGVGIAGGAEASSGAATPLLTMPAALPPTVPDALGYPRASFWERLGAGLIDIILVSILGGMIGGPPQGFLLAAAYFIGLWMWKGTTVGGVVVQLRVVRQDGQKITFPMALVRLLVGVFSMMVFFVGFLWIAWDPEKQSWHDKVAGTVVVRMPKGMPLLLI